MTTYFDQNRIIRDADRRLHAADVEQSGGFIQIVPAIAQRIVPGLNARALLWSDGTLRQREAMASEQGEKEEVREQRWWVEQWRRPNGLYRIRLLNEEQRAIANELLEANGLPKEAFPRARGDLKDDNDAQLVAEIMALRGTMIVTSNAVLIRRKPLDDWLKRNQNRRVGVTVDRLLADVDPLYCSWWKKDEAGPRALAKIVIGAYWPKNAMAGTEEIVKSVDHGLARLERGHLTKFARLVKERLADEEVRNKAIQQVRAKLPIAARKAEQEREMIVKGTVEEPLEGQVKVDKRRDTFRRYDWES